MTSPKQTAPFSHVKHLREVRDRINKEVADMTLEERHRLHKAEMKEDTWWAELEARAKPPNPGSAQRGADQDE